MVKLSRNYQNSKILAAQLQNKILIVGASGLLGRDLAIYLSSMYDVICTHNKNPMPNHKSIFLDLNNIKHLSKTINELKPNVVINCSAFTNVDLAETERYECRKVNYEGVRNLCSSLHKDVYLIHVSTDYVFDGKKGDYKEEDFPLPINYYGKTKLEGENYIRGNFDNYLIVRPNVLYSNNIIKSNFFSWIYNSLKNQKNINVVTDQISNPVYINDFIRILNNCILLRFTGILHYGSEDYISRFDFALLVAKIFNFDSSLVNKITTNDLNQVAKRPLNSSLNISKALDNLPIESHTTDYYLNKILS